MIKEGDWVSWICPVEGVKKYGVVQEVNDVVFEMEVNESFELPPSDADLSLFGDKPLFKEAEILGDDNKTYAVKLKDLEVLSTEERKRNER